MREAKYTPGPWHVKSGAVWAEAKDGAILKLASVNAVLHYVSMAERNENAILMAAAPELLEALKDALAFLDRPDIPTYEWYKLAPEHVGEFRRAIARAEGRE